MDDNVRLSDLSPYMPAIITALVLLVVFFPAIAALVAPQRRRWTFFFLTLFVLPGPIGVACAAIASPRPAEDRLSLGDRIAGPMSGYVRQESSPTQ